VVIGPLEFVVMEFPEETDHTSIVEEVRTLLEGGAIRIVDMVFVTRDASGTSFTELGDADDASLAGYQSLPAQLAGLLTPDDIEELASLVTEGSRAIVVLFEHVWAINLNKAVVQAGAEVRARERISGAVLEEVTRELALA
jgi:hypothetical protein